jgi:hypothetical protein
MSEPDIGPMTDAEAESLVRRTVVAMTVEGHWYGLCVCGQESGMSLGEPTPDDRRYIVCPACGRKGRDGEVRWVRSED